MKLFRWLGVAAVLALFTACATTEKWHPATGPLKTRWAAEVSPRNVWPEYPRPQMVRKNWLNLNGLWDYAIWETNVDRTGPYEGKILVPFPVESALSGVMRRLNETHHLVYRRTFSLPKKWDGRRVLLHFGAVDWQTKVYINGMEVGTHRGGYDPFTFDITDALKPGQTQEIVVDVFDPTEGGQPRGKQVREPNGIWYTPTSGIWQTVWLEPVPKLTSIEDLAITPDIDNKLLRLTVQLRNGQSDNVVEAVVLDHGKKIGFVRGQPGAELQIPIAEPKLWSPDHPFLYKLKVELGNSGSYLSGGKETLRTGPMLDSVKSYFAMRKISVGKDDKGINRLMLNDRPLFQIGTLDQGFWPDGIYTPPSDAAMRYDLEMTKKLGFNMVRKHVKVEPDRWYYDCDKLGLLVWQDMPGAYLGNRTKAQKIQFEQELRQMILTHRNHPCIVMWVLFNEGWGQYDTERLTGVLKKLDPSRLVDDASGWTDKNVGDVRDHHKYPEAVAPVLEENRAAVQGEFGGLGLPMEGHTWAKKTWGYQGMGGRKELTQRYVDVLGKVLKLKAEGLSAAVYTQISDVETECNGLMTYDREILKPDPAAVATVNKKLQQDSP